MTPWLPRRSPAEETTIQGTLALNNYKHTFQRYTAVLAPDASVPMIDVAVREDADSGRVKAKLVQRARVIFKEDSAAVDAIIGQSIETRVFGTQAGAIPYLNMSFALLEQAIRRARAPGATAGQVPFFNLGGGQTVSGTLQSVGSDSLALAIGDVEFRLQGGSRGPGARRGDSEAERGGGRSRAERGRVGPASPR